MMLVAQIAPSVAKGAASEARLLVDDEFSWYNQPCQTQKYLSRGHSICLPILQW